jgi:hypothetical protein
MQNNLYFVYLLNIEICKKDNWYAGSPQSKEDEEINTEILQWLARKVDPENGRVPSRNRK